MQKINQNHIIAVALALLLALMLPLSWPQSSLVAPVSLQITATGEKNSEAKSSEIWLERIEGTKTISAAQLFGHQPGWVNRDGALASYQDQPVTLTWLGQLPAGAKLIFSSHPFVGVVDIYLNGVTQRLDLYSPKSTSFALPLVADGQATIQQSPPFYAYALPILSVVILAFIFFSFLVRAKAAPVTLTPAAFRWAYGAPMLLSGFLSLLAFYPAQMSPDSVTMYDGIIQHHWSNAHSVLIGWFLWPFMQIWSTPAWAPFFQILALAAALSFVFSELARWGVSQRIIWLAAMLVAILPINPIMVTHFWKDVGYSIAVLFLTGQLMQLYRTEGQLLLNRRWLLCLGGTLFLTAALRINGVAIAMLLLPALFLAYRPYWRPLAIFSAVLVGMLVAYNSVLLPIAKVKPIGENYNAIIPIHVLGAYHQAGVTFDTETAAQFAKVLPADAWASAYDCQTVVPLFWHKQIDYAQAIDNNSLLWQTMLGQIFARPDIFLQHQFCVTSSLWRINPAPQEKLSTVTFGVADMPDAQRLQLAAHPIVPQLKSMFVALANVPSALMWRPALYLFALILLAVTLFLAVRRGAVLVPFVPILANTLSLALLMQSPDFRYQWSLVLVLLCLWPLWFRRADNR